MLYDCGGCIDTYVITESDHPYCILGLSYYIHCEFQAHYNWP